MKKKGKIIIYGMSFLKVLLIFIRRKIIISASVLILSDVSILDMPC